MDTSEFDPKIGNLEKEMKIFREQMEKTCDDFLIATNEFIIDWFNKSVQDSVQRNPDITKKHGIEGLRNLKSDLNDLILRVPDLVNQHLNKDAYWGHRDTISDGKEKLWGRYSLYRALGPIDGPLDEGTRIIFGYVGEILIKYGYVSLNETKIVNYWTSIGSNRLRYSIGYNWSEKMSEIFKKYSDQYDKLIKMDNELKSLKRNKSEAEAKNLWDQAQ